MLARLAPPLSACPGNGSPARSPRGRTLSARLVRPLAALAGLAALAFAPAAPAFAHGVGSSQFVLEVSGANVDGTWELNLRDARFAIGLDPAVDGPRALDELRAHEAELRALMARSLAIAGDSVNCPITLTPAPMKWDEKWHAVIFGIHAACAAPFTRMTLHVELLFDRDPAHRAYFMVADARATSVGVLRENLREVTFGVKQFRPLEIAVEFVREGLWHIWTGLDHLLFLFALLLPAALVRRDRTWEPRAGFAPVWHEVVKVVTAFTVAHSITLALGFFGLFRPPSQWVEVGIALSVFAAAWNNLRPYLPGRAWVMAFGFGLVHGLGFAGVLNNLSLPRHARALALGAFNVGVELGQLAVVAVVLPLLYAASRRRWFPRFVMGIGSLAIAWLALVWVLERAFSLQLTPFR